MDFRIKMSVCKYCSREFNSEKMLERHYTSCKDKSYHDQIEKLTQKYEKMLEDQKQQQQQITENPTDTKDEFNRVGYLVEKYETKIAGIIKEKTNLENKCSEYARVVCKFQGDIIDLQRKHKEEIERLKNNNQLIEELENCKKQLEKEKNEFQQGLAYMYRENEKRFKNVRKQMLILKTFVEGKITLVIDEETLLKLSIVGGNNNDNNNDNDDINDIII
jgi:chromosome segregation ATPase